MWGKIPLLLAATGAWSLLGTQTGCSHSCTYASTTSRAITPTMTGAVQAILTTRITTTTNTGAESVPENYGESCPYARCVAH